MTHRSGKTNSVRCAVGNTIKEAVEIFRARFGGSVRVRQYKKHPNWKPLWVWEIKDRNAEAFLKEILPHLRLKKYQAEIALELLELTPRRGCYVKNMTEEQMVEREQSFQKRDALAEALRTANKRGLN